MQCSACQSGNPEGAKFCNQCGTALDAVASSPIPAQSFDEKLARIQRYLPEGLSQKILSQRDRIEGERRHVTVMFCDMEGFTPLAERLGAEEAYSIMGEIYEILIRQVHDYEGTINEMTGDGIMALFGAPIALEEAPQRALWAAEAIHREMEVFNKKSLELDPVRMRIGVHSGPVVVGTLGNDLRVEFKAVGDTVNLASRMERMAEPGTTFVTRETFKLTRGLFEFENLGRKVVKGKGESLPVYKVMPGRQDAHRPRLGSERMIFSQMVGRKNKLDQLELQLLKLINGSGSVINIIGEAGIGKSRLVAEMLAREASRRVTVLEGRAVSMGRNLSFHPIVDLLKQWARIRVEDDEDSAFTKLEAAVWKDFPDKIGDLLPFVATLMGIDLPGNYRKRVQGIEGDALEKLIRKTVRELFMGLCEPRPLVIIIDDLHWSDRSSIELLEYLFRLVKQERILFINIFRPGYVETGQRIQTTISRDLPDYQVDMFLEPLDDRMSEAMISDMLDLKGFNQAVVRQIVQRAEGNPYFIEEVVRSFIDEGAVRLRGSKFELTDKFETITIPNSIYDVLMARIDRLEENARDLLKIAAVIGRNFFYRILAEVANRVDDVDDRLTYLKKTQLILERERLEELEYQFKHALTQEAAYASILPQKCKALHLKVADSIERVFAKKLHAFYGMLAYHYSRAENLEKAEGALIKAGEEALKSSASSEALHYYQEALNLYRQKAAESADSAKVALLEKNIAIALFNRGQYEEAVDYFDKALYFYWGEKPDTSRFSSSGLLSGLFHLVASVWFPILKFRQMPSEQDRVAVDLFFRKIKALGIIDPKRYFFDSLRFYKRISQFDLSHFDPGYGLFAGASSLFSFSGLSFRISRKILLLVANQIGREEIKSFIVYDFVETLHHYLYGNWQTIKPVDDELIKENLNIGEVYLASLNLHWHCIHRQHQGDLATAERLIAWLDEIAEIYENEFSQLLKLLLNTSLLVECRKLQEAFDEVEAGLEFAKQNNFGLALIHFWGCKAQIHILRDEVEDAEVALNNADKISREMDTIPWQLSYFYKARAAFSVYGLQRELVSGAPSGKYKSRVQAMLHCRALIKQARKVAQHRTDAYRLMGRYFWLTQKHKHALRWYRKSMRTGVKLGAGIQLARPYQEIGQRLKEPGSPATRLAGMEAQDYLAKARNMFEEMNLTMDIQQLDNMESVHPER